MAAIELGSAYINVVIGTADVSAQTKKVFGQFENQATRAGASAGRSMGAALAAANPAADAEKQIQRLTQASQKAAADVTTARRGEEAAARKVAIEEAKLAELRDKGTATRSQMLAAEDRLARAMLGAEAASRRAAAAVSVHEKALGDLGAASQQSERELAQADYSGFVGALKKAGTRAGAALTEGVGGAASRINETAQSIGKKFSESLGEAVTKFGPVALGAAAVGGLASAFNASAERSGINRSLEAQFVDSPGVAKKIGAAAGKAYGDAWGDSYEEVASVTEAIQSSFGDAATMTVDQTAAVTGKVMAIAQANGVEAESIVASVGVAMKSGLAKNSTEALDMTAAALAKMPKAVKEELFEASNEYAKHFNQLGISGPAAYGALAEASKLGVYGIDKTGDAIKEFTIRSTDMSESTRNVYSAMGLEWKKTTKDILGGGEGASKAFQEVVTKLKGIKDPGDQAAASLALFGTPLEDLGTDKIPEFLNAISAGDSELKGFAGAADRTAGALTTPTAGFEKMKRALGGSFQTAIEKLSPAFTQISESISKNAGPWIEKFSKKIEEGATYLAQFEAPAKQVVTTIGTLGATIAREAGPALAEAVKKLGALGTWATENQTTIKIIGGVVAGFAVAIGTMNAALAVSNGAMKIYAGWQAAVRGAQILATGAQWAFNAAMTANPIGLIVVGVAALVGGFIYLWRNVDGFASFFIDAWGKIQGAWNTSIQWVTGTAWPAITGFFSMLGSTVSDAAGAVAGWFVSMKDGALGAWDTFTGALHTGWQWLSDNVFSPIQNVVGVVVGGAFKALEWYVTTYWNLVSGVLVGGYNVIKDFVVDPMVWVFGTAVPAAFKYLGDQGALIWGGLTNALFAGWNWLKTNVWDPNVYFYTVMIPNAFNTLKNLASEKWNQLTGLLFAGWNWLKTNVWDPNVYFYTVMIPNAFNTLKNAASEKWNQLTGLLFAGWNWLKTNVWDPNVYFYTVVIPNAFNTMKDAASEKWNQFTGLISAGWTALKGATFDPIATLITQTFPGWFETAKNGVKTAWDGIQEAAKKPVSFVVNTVFKGLTGALDQVLGFLGLPKINFQGVPGLATGGLMAQAAPMVGGGAGRQLAFASGGIVPGPRSVGRDNQQYVNPTNGHRINLASDEGVLHQYGVDALGGGAAFERFNAISRDRGPVAGREYLDTLMHGGAGYAGGGVISPRAVGDWLPDWAKTARSAVKRTASDAWDGTVNGTKYVAGKAWGGVTWLGNKAVETGTALSGLVRDAAEALADPSRLMQAVAARALGGLQAAGPMGDLARTAPQKLALDAGHYLVGRRDTAEADAKKRAEIEAPGSTAPLPPRGGAGQPYGSQQIAAVGRAAFPDIAVTSTFRGGARTAAGGYASFHSLNRAVDFAAPMNAAGIARMGQMFEWWLANYRPSELLYSPKGGRQLNRGGRPGDTSGATKSMHYNHVHVGFADGGLMGGIGGKLAAVSGKAGIYDNGGWLEPGGIAINASARPEPVFSSAQWDLMARNPGAAADAAAIGRAVAEALRDQRPIAIDYHDYSGATTITKLDKLADDIRVGGRF